MDAFQIRAMRDSANFLYEWGIPRNFLWELLDESFKSHEWMEKTLGLKRENNYRIVLPIPKELGNKDAFSAFVEEICHIKNHTGGGWIPVDKVFIEDGKKNKYKITRLLSGQPDLWKKLWLTKAGREMAYLSGKFTCCLDCTIANNEYFQTFLLGFPLWYGEQVKSGWQVVLSCHPADILTASSNSSFISCYRPDGEYFNGVISIMLSANTLISSVEEVDRPGYKIGRAWIYINHDMICIGRPYGSFLPEYNLVIRNYLYGKMGGKWVHKPTAKIGDGYIIQHGPGFLDCSYGDVTLVKGKIFSEIEKVILPRAICLFCGTKHNNFAAKGICQACSTTVSKEELSE